MLDADTVRLSAVVEWSFYSDESNATFATAPRTDDLHMRLALL